MYELLSWIESSALGHVMRESSAWTYPLVNLAHVMGIAALFGSVLVIDLALMGVGDRRTLPALAGAAPPIAMTGFAVALLSGVGLLSSNATEYQSNPFLLIKFPAIAAAAINALLLRRSEAWRALGRRALTPGEARYLARMGAVSVGCWTTALATGRLVGYW